MEDKKDTKELTHEELVAEAIALILRSESWEIEKAIKAVFAAEEKAD